MWEKAAKIFHLHTLKEMLSEIIETVVCKVLYDTSYDAEVFIVVRVFLMDVFA